MSRGERSVWDDTAAVRFLQHVLPRLQMRWPGFRRVRRQVWRRIRRRAAALGLDHPATYLDHLEAHPAEWAVLDSLCRVTISRFFRDRAVFAALESEILPALSARAVERRVQVLSVGCASGEEPYTLALIRDLGSPPGGARFAMDILALDVDAQMLERARASVYPAGCLRDLPAGWSELGFDVTSEGYRLKPRYRQDVTFVRQDVREGLPAGPFDLVLCRNLAFTYFAESVQIEVAGRLLERMHAGGFMVLGSHEVWPGPVPGVEEWRPGLSILRRTEF